VNRDEDTRFDDAHSTVIASETLPAGKSSVKMDVTYDERTVVPWEAHVRRQSVGEWCSREPLLPPSGVQITPRNVDSPEGRVVIVIFIDSGSST
jgi:hypothetical protein